MKIAVWDTYVKRKNGTVLHFDILVPESQIDSDTIYRYGTEYLASIGEDASGLSAEQCRFCHVEEPAEEAVRSINQKGYYILEMDEIPASLPENPTRRDIILHLRGHYPNYRFANFRGVSDDEIKSLLQALTNA